MAPTLGTTPLQITGNLILRSRNHPSIERRHRHVLAPEGGIYRTMRIDDHNVTRLGNVNCLEGRRKISGEGLDCHRRAYQAYSLEEGPHVRGHRIESSHAIRNGARD